MKNKFLAASLLILAAALLSSCDGSMTSAIDKILSIADGNIFIDSGLSDVDKAEVAKAIDLIKEGETSSSSREGNVTTTVAGNIEVKQSDGGATTIKVGAITLSFESDSLGEDLSFSSPIEDEKLDTLSNLINSTVTACGKDKELSKELSKPVEGEAKAATVGTFALAEAISEKISESTELSEEVRNSLHELSLMAGDLARSETITVAEMLTAQLIVGIASDVATINRDESISDEENARLTARIVDQALDIIALSKTDACRFDISAIEGLTSLVSSN